VLHSTSPAPAALRACIGGIGDIFAIWRHTSEMEDIREAMLEEKP